MKNLIQSFPLFLCLPQEDAARMLSLDGCLASGLWIAIGFLTLQNCEKQISFFLQMMVSTVFCYICVIVLRCLLTMPACAFGKTCVYLIEKLTILCFYHIWGFHDLRNVIFLNCFFRNMVFWCFHLWLQDLKTLHWLTS